MKGPLARFAQELRLRFILWSELVNKVYLSKKNWLTGAWHIDDARPARLAFFQ